MSGKRGVPQLPRAESPDIEGNCRIAGSAAQAPMAEASSVASQCRWLLSDAALHPEKQKPGAVRGRPKDLALRKTFLVDKADILLLKTKAW